MTLFLILLFSFAGITYADVNKEHAKYFKCYGQLVRQRLPKDDSQRPFILAGKLTGAEACRRLLKRAKFGENLLLERPKDKVALAILKTMQSFHNQWFPRFNFNVKTQDYSNTNVFDFNEMGYHLTHALFAPEGKYADIFTDKTSFLGVRRSKVENKYANDRDIMGERYPINDPNRKWKVGGTKDDPSEFSKEYFWRPTLVSFGQLIGLKRHKPKADYFQRIIVDQLAGWIDLKYPAFNGVMGTIPFLLLNAGQSQRTMDGGQFLHRRWSTSLFESLLCRSLPHVRAMDVKGKANPSSQLSFRKKEKCMQCHISMDNLAGLTRNLELTNTGEISHTEFTFRAVYKHPVTLPSQDVWPDKDPYFYQRPPSGRLVFRTLDGTLIDQHLNHPNELGKYLSQLNDPYICAAKRYFHFYTGVDVDLYDFKEYSVGKEEKRKLSWRNFVVHQGKLLKQHQSLMQLSQNIFESEFYGQ